jgi:uncharacterized protein (DUF1778 family)
MAATTSMDSKRKARQATKTKRIAFRLTDELNARLERAVAISGRSQSDLITEAIAEKASEIEREQYYLELSERDMDALLEAIANPPPLTATMERSIARWRETFAPE